MHSPLSFGGRTCIAAPVCGTRPSPSNHKVIYFGDTPRNILREGDRFSTVASSVHQNPSPTTSPKNQAAESLRCCDAGSLVKVVHVASLSPHEALSTPRPGIVSTIVEEIGRRTSKEDYRSLVELVHAQDNQSGLRDDRRFFLRTSFALEQSERASPSLRADLGAITQHRNGLTAVAHGSEVVRCGNGKCRSLQKAELAMVPDLQMSSRYCGAV